MSHNNFFGCVHKCINCECEISSEEYQINNCLCDQCAESDRVEELYNDIMKETGENDQ